MSPLTKITKTPDGKFETISFQASESVFVCVGLDPHSIVDAYFEDGQTRRRAYALGLDEAASVQIALNTEQAWHRWVWMWETKQEANEALKHVPDDLGLKLEQLVQKIDDFLSRARETNIQGGPSQVRLDITPDLKSIGWQITLLDHTREEAAGTYSTSMKAIKKRQKN
jgi:hypothetical protein